MQRTARELSLSETAFLLAGDHQSEAAVRIFTPVTELPFAGHPVLGAAAVVAGERNVYNVRLRTGAGIVNVRLRRSGDEVFHGEMEQPHPEQMVFDREPELLQSLGVSQPLSPVKAYRNGPVHLYVELSSAEEVAALRPDLRALGELGSFGVSCFARVREGVVKTRMFAPSLGVDEDPATGSAAGPLALHLVREGALKQGEGIEIHQGVEIGRPSLLQARVEGAADGEERVLVGGAAIFVAHGSYLLA